MVNFFALSTIISLLSLNALAQKPQKAVSKLGPNPLYFVDSVATTAMDLQPINPRDIASVTIVTGKTALKLGGQIAGDGIAYIETKSFARGRYWRYFRTKSTEYCRVVPTAASDSIIQYVLNKKIQTKDFEGDLSSINDEIFKGITIITTAELEKQFGIHGKQYGVLIQSAKPADLYHGKKKF